MKRSKVTDYVALMFYLTIVNKHDYWLAGQYMYIDKLLKMHVIVLFTATSKEIYTPRNLCKRVYFHTCYFLAIVYTFKEIKSATMNIFRKKKSFLFKSFVKAELS